MDLYSIIAVPVMRAIGDSIEYLTINFVDYIVSGAVRVNQAVLADESASTSCRCMLERLEKWQWQTEQTINKTILQGNYFYGFFFFFELLYLCFLRSVIFSCYLEYSRYRLAILYVYFLWKYSDRGVIGLFTVQHWRLHLAKPFGEGVKNLWFCMDLDEHTNMFGVGFFAVLRLWIMLLTI